MVKVISYAKKKKKVAKRRPVKKRGRTKKATSVIDRIGPIGFNEDDGFSINLYGKSASGKTTLWGTFPSPILAIVCSGGKKPGELRSLDTPANRKRIDQVVLRESDELKKLIEHQEETSHYKTIVLDHGTGLQDFVLKEILGLDELPAQKSWGLASREQYGQCTMQTKEYFRALLSLTCYRVIVAQEREFNTDGDESILEPYVSSALTPSLVGWLNPACDYIAETFIRQRMVEKTMTIKRKKIKRKVKGEGVDYCLRVGPHAVYTTKFRLPKGTPLPEVIVDPDYDKIMKLVQGG